MKDELRQLVSQDETVLYEGKPDKKCFLFESIFNPLLPVAIVWAILDFGILGATLFDASPQGMAFFMIPFMFLHLMPVWLYLGGVLFSFRKYRNTHYIVTDHAIYVSGGIFRKTFDMKPFAELSHVNLHRGLFDQLFRVGDVIITTDQMTNKNTPATLSLNSISDYVEVYNLVKKLQKDIYADVMYPNDKRPPENHGYHTKYKG